MQYSGIGSAGSVFNSGSESYPIYSGFDFNDAKCSTKSGSIENYNISNQVRNCRLSGLPDLAQDHDYVKNKLAEYLNSLIDFGVAGFRIDAAKHMWPTDLKAIYEKLKNVRQDIFGVNKRPFLYQEVIDMGGEPIKSTDYTSMGRVTEFKYGINLSNVVLKKNNLKMADLKNFGTEWGFIPDGDSLVFIDNHDNQRGHGGGGLILTFFERRKYTIANCFMMAWPYGFVQIISSYNFTDSSQGPPSNKDGETINVSLKRDGSCNNGWICEHRWNEFYKMVKFRNVVGSELVNNWWDNGLDKIAFSRGTKGFIAINNDDSSPMIETLKTSLAPGTYCDIISGSKKNRSCTGKVIKVNSNGFANINIKNSETVPVIAIHLDSKI